MGTLFLGITYRAVRLEALPFESGYPTVISQIARQVLGGGPAIVPFHPGSEPLLFSVKDP